MVEDSSSQPSTPSLEPSSGRGSRSGRDGREPAPIDRRSVLRSAVGVGYALGLAGYVGSRGVPNTQGAAEDVTVPVARVRRDPTDPGTMETRSRTVSARWHEVVSNALALHENLVTTGVPGYVRSGVVPGSHDDPSARISLGVTAEEFGDLPEVLETLLSAVDLDGSVPTDGVSLDVDRLESLKELEAGPSPTASPSYADRIDLEGVPGGVRCRAGPSDVTLMPALFHPQRDGRSFGTALHALESPENASDRPVWLLSERGRRRLIGHTRTAHPAQDVVVADPRQAVRPVPEISADGTIPVAGQYTRWGIADLIARDVTIEKVGGTTGHSSGRIGVMASVDCVVTDDCLSGQLVWGGEEDMSDGDSGSVSFRRDPVVADDALVVSINVARTWWPGQDYVWGPAAYELTDRTGYHF